MDLRCTGVKHRFETIWVLGRIKAKQNEHELTGLVGASFPICEMGILILPGLIRWLPPKNLLIESSCVFPDIHMAGRSHRNWLENVCRPGSSSEPLAEL